MSTTIDTTVTGTLDAIHAEPSNQENLWRTATTDHAKRELTVARLDAAEGVLFDASGHVRRGTRPAIAVELLALVNSLRTQLGWLTLDMEHHECWPASAATYEEHRRLCRS